MADLVQLAGTDRTLQSVTMWLACGTNFEDGGEVDVIFRVRAYDANTGMPGIVLSEASGRATYDWMSFKVTLTMPQVELPDQVVVGAELLNGVDERYGVVPAGPVTVGSSDPEHWFFNDNGWIVMNGGNSGIGNLGIEVSAVPEPASVAAVGLGLAALLRRRPRR